MNKSVKDFKVYLEGENYAALQGGGTRTYLDALIPELVRLGVELELLLPNQGTDHTLAIPPVSTRKRFIPSIPHFPEGRLKKLLSGYRRELEAFFWERHLRSNASLRLFHSVSYGLAPTSDLPQVSLIHDLAVEKFPEIFGVEGDNPNDDLVRAKKRQTIQRSHRIIAVSEQTKKDLTELAGVPESKIDVIYHGVDAAFFAQPSSPSQIREFLAPLNITSPYLLHVGGRLRHKNFARLAEAFAQSPVHKDFLLVGTSFALQDEEQAYLKKLGILDRIRIAPNLDRAGLRMLYQNAAVFIYPSLYEGFGIPIVEAMAAGVPVAASKRGPLPEVGGDAAAYFNPDDANDIAKSFESLLEKATSERFRALGKIRAAQFTWSAAAEKTLACYLKCLA